MIRLFGRRVPVLVLIGFLIVGAIVCAGALAPWIAPYGEAELAGGVWDPPSAHFLLGTDSLGRDMLSRLLYGTRTTVSIALVTTLLAFAVGVSLGFLAAAMGGIVDLVLSRIVDIVMAVPVLITALMVLAVLGTSIPVMVGTIGITEATRVFRVARAVAQNIVVLDFVAAARLRGEGLAWILAHEVLPNALPPLIAEFGMRFCFVFLFIAALSFLGLGIQPPYADWGSMVRDNAQAINFGGYAPLFPAGAIALLTIGVNLIVDWLLSVHAQPRDVGREP